MGKENGNIKQRKYNEKDKKEGRDEKLKYQIRNETLVPGPTVQNSRLRVNLPRSLDLK